MSKERGLLIKMVDLSPCASHMTYVHIIHRDTILQMPSEQQGPGKLKFLFSYNY